MGYVTDGGLEPEPVASIKAAADAVNGFLARFEGIFGDFGRFSDFEGAGAGRRRDGGADVGVPGDGAGAGRGGYRGEIPACAGMTVLEAGLTGGGWGRHNCLAAPPDFGAARRVASDEGSPTDRPVRKRPVTIPRIRVQSRRRLASSFSCRLPSWRGDGDNAGAEGV